MICFSGCFFVHFIFAFRTDIVRMMLFCFTQNGEGPAGPPGPAGVPGINGIDVSALSVSSIRAYSLAAAFGSATKSNVFCFRGKEEQMVKLDSR